MQQLIARCRGWAFAFTVMAVVQFVNYVNLVINIRAISVANVPAAVFTDAVAAAITYFIIRKISKEESVAALIGMILGGGLASWAGIELTRHWR